MQLHEDAQRMAVLLCRVVDLVEPDDAGLQTNLVLPGVFPVLHHTVTHTESERLDAAAATRAS